MELGEEVEEKTGRANEDFQTVRKTWMIVLKMLDN
jgi:hypothetical protein